MKETITAEMVQEKHSLLSRESSKKAATAIQDIIDYWEDYGEPNFADRLREAFNAGKPLRHLCSHHDVRINWRILLESEGKKVGGGVGAGGSAG